MLELKNIKKDYVTASETVNALKGVNLTFRDREFVSILGPSGCGKTTLLNIIGGLDKYTSGDLIINGRSTKSYKDRDWDVYRNHRVGFIFQSYNLIPHQTVLGNVELALTISGIEKKERVRRAKEALDRVGLSEQYYKRPNQLSGGQCQRVAIARALVNDPEILLADEPTGALDTQTSVQIMNLIREIAGERLVIMVTHNPELAEQYSTRIINLLDGLVVKDTNPVSDRELKAANVKLRREKRHKSKAHKKEKAKMSPLTAFKLSARNLVSKKGRTAMVGVAGSIGIIGIALVLAFSAGIKGYVASMQDDMLSGNPITIRQSAYDINAITDMMNNFREDGDLPVKDENMVYVSSLINYLVKMNKDMEDMLLENDITKEYVDFVKAMPEEYYNAIIYGYGIDMTTNIFTDFKYSENSEAENISLHRLLNVAKSILAETDIKDQADSIVSLAPSFKQMPDNPSYILSQYNLIAGSKVATEKNEIMLVLNSDDELSDIFLASLGYFTQEEIIEIINKANSPDENYTSPLYKEAFSYDELLGKSFVWYPNNTVFTESPALNIPGMTLPKMYQYNSSSSVFSEKDKGDGVELEIVGILTPKDSVSFGSLSSGIYYTEALGEHILEVNANSNIIDYLHTDDAKAFLSQTVYNLIYTYTYVYDNGDGDLTPKTASAAIGPQLTMEEMLQFMINKDEAIKNLDTDDMINRFVRLLGGNEVANSVTIYPSSFETKYLVTDYLDRWNEKGELTYGDVTLTERTDINYTDTIELVVNLINGMIDVVSAALIAFTSISLVVSTVMIGIITYVSVVERIKEIGVIRSLGGRKKDVSRLFTAETFIIGMLSGLFGVAATYGIAAIASAIIEALFGIPNIAFLPVDNALILVALSTFLTLISGVLPARSAARKDPVVALRTE